MRWLKDVWTWLQCFPRPFYRVTINGNIRSTGGTLFVGQGVQITVNGNIEMEKRDANLIGSV